MWSSTLFGSRVFTSFELSLWLRTGIVLLISYCTSVEKIYCPRQNKTPDILSSQHIDPLNPNTWKMTAFRFISTATRWIKGDELRGGWYSGGKTKKRKVSRWEDRALRYTFEEKIKYGRMRAHNNNSENASVIRLSVRGSSIQYCFTDSVMV